tara:strand:- start:560 stop:1216 length:657 start_codon:yes stop_codon:yes gene_type:complete
MTLPSSGALSLNSIQGEFGGSNPIGLNEYYRGGSLVPNHSNTTSIPTSGTIDVQDFYGTSATSPLDLTHNINMKQFTQGAGKNMFTMYGYSTNYAGTPVPSATDVSISAGGYSATITDSDKIKNGGAIYAVWAITFNMANIALYLYNNYSGCTFQGMGFVAWNSPSNVATGFTFTPPTASTTNLVWGGMMRANSATMNSTFDSWANGRLNQNTSIVIS